MIRLRRLPGLCRLPRDQRGATIVEFGLVAGPMIIMMLALVDLGYRQYMNVALQGALDAAARKVTVGGITTDQVDGYINQRLSAFLKNAQITVVRTNYDTFSQVGKPEKITTDTAPIGTYNQGDCFEDLNGNGVWDAIGSRSGTGGSDDVVYYTATMTFTALVPLKKFLGWSSTETVTGSTMMRNQPYASQADPAIVCS